MRSTGRVYARPVKSVPGRALNTSEGRGRRRRVGRPKFAIPCPRLARKNMRTLTAERSPNLVRPLLRPAAASLTALVGPLSTFVGS